MLRKVERLYIELTRFKNLFVSKTNTLYIYVKTCTNTIDEYLNYIDKNFRINYQNNYIDKYTIFYILYLFSYISFLIRD